MRTRPHLFFSASHHGKMSLIFPQVRVSGRQGCVVWVWLLRLGPLTGHWAHQSFRMTQVTALSPRKLTILSPITYHPHKSSGHCPAFPASFPLKSYADGNSQRRPRSLENPTVWTRDSCSPRQSHSALCNVLVPAPSGLQCAHPIGNHNSRDMEITA